MTATEEQTHISFNGWFWNRPDTGSGQYIRHLVNGMRQMAPGLKLTVIAPQGWDLDVAEGVETIQPPLKRGGHLGKVLFEQNIFPKTAADIHADIAHVPYWGGPLQSRVPVVVTIHDIIPLILPAYRGGVLARLYTGLVAASARGAAAVLTDSEASKADIIEHLNISPDRVEAIHLAVSSVYHDRGANFVDMAIRQQYNLPEKYVFYMGGFDVRKNVRHLLKAYTYVRAGLGSEVPLVIAGRLPSKITKRFDDIPRLIEEQNISDAVQLIGYVEDDHKPSLYRMANVFAYPSEYEGFGLPVLEAMACGTPVVTTNAASIPEIVGDAAFVVNPNDARGMAGSILALLNQPPTTTDMKQRGLAQAKKFSWADTIAQTIAIYGKVLTEVR